MKFVFPAAAAFAAFALVNTNAEEQAAVAVAEDDDGVELQTWEEFMHEYLFTLMSKCEEMDERDDENIPWTCDRFYLHEDAYPALQVRRMLLSFRGNESCALDFVTCATLGDTCSVYLWKLCRIVWHQWREWGGRSFTNSSPMNT
jgi:hypothetical protein